LPLQTIQYDGDAVEKAHWAAIEPVFPHYQEFWRTHLVPLRCEGSIQPRQGVDEDFEFLAMFHYSTFVYLSRSSEKLQDPEDGFHFPGEFYVSLYAAAELAGKVVSKWSEIYSACLEKDPKVDTTQLERLKERFRTYRNQIHEQLLALLLDPSKDALMCRPEKIDKYKKWTDVLYTARTEDFVKVRLQTNHDYQSLCSALETTWKRMCELSDDLIKNREYLQRRGRSVVSFTVSGGPAVSGTVLLGSATAVSAVWSSEWTLGLKKETP
jgi:hypothetical protein